MCARGLICAPLWRGRGRTGNGRTLLQVVAGAGAQDEGNGLARGGIPVESDVLAGNGREATGRHVSRTAAGMRVRLRAMASQVGDRTMARRDGNSRGRDNEGVLGSGGQGGEAGNEDAGDGVLHLDGVEKFWFETGRFDRWFRLIKRVGRVQARAAMMSTRHTKNARFSREQSHYRKATRRLYRKSGSCWANKGLNDGTVAVRE